MKVCDFKEPSFLREKNLIDLYYGAKITFANNLVVTMNHQPKRIFDGETVLVLENGVLYARFEGVNDRLYRYVRQGKFLHCSYIYRISEHHNRSNVENTEVRHIKKLHVFEICLTNTPVNKGTICTVDSQHPAVQNINWMENIDRVQSDGVEKFQFESRLEEFEQRLKELDRHFNKILTKRGIKNGEII